MNDEEYRAEAVALRHRENNVFNTPIIYGTRGESDRTSTGSDADSDREEVTVHQGILSQIEDNEPQNFSLFTGREGVRQFEEAMREYISSPRPSVVEQMKDVNDKLQAAQWALSNTIAKNQDVPQKGKFLGNIGV